MKRKRGEQDKQPRSPSSEEINRFFGLDDEEENLKRHRSEPKASSSSSSSSGKENDSPNTSSFSLRRSPSFPVLPVSPLSDRSSSSSSSSSRSPHSPVSLSSSSSNSPASLSDSDREMAPEPVVQPASVKNPLDTMRDMLRYLPISFIGSKFSHTDKDGKRYFIAKPYKWPHQDVRQKSRILVARIKDFEIFVKTLVYIFTDKSLFKDKVVGFTVNYFPKGQQEPSEKVNLIDWLERLPALKFGLSLIAKNHANKPKVLRLFEEMLQAVLPTITSSKSLKSFGWDRNKMLNGRMTSFMGMQPALVQQRSQSDSAIRLGGASSMSSPMPLSMQRASSAPDSSSRNAGGRAPSEFKADGGNLSLSSDSSLGIKPSKPKVKPSNNKKSSSKIAKGSAAVKTKLITSFFSDKKAESKREAIVIDDEPKVQQQARPLELSRVLSSSSSSNSSNSPASHEPMGVLLPKSAQPKPKRKGIRPHSALMASSPFPSPALSFKPVPFYSPRVDLKEGIPADADEDKENKHLSSPLRLSSSGMQQYSHSPLIPPLSGLNSRSSVGDVTNSLSSSASKLPSSRSAHSHSHAQFTHPAGMSGFMTARQYQDQYMRDMGSLSSQGKS